MKFLASLVRCASTLSKGLLTPVIPPVLTKLSPSLPIFPSINPLTGLVTGLLDPLDPLQNNEMFALKILKIRRQKMNKHKWKKRSRILRRSAKKIQRKKQE